MNNNVDTAFINRVGIWPRIIAFVFDYIIISLYIGLTVGVTVGLNSISPELAQRPFNNRLLSQVAGFLIMTLPVTLYFAILEASSWQASWGKRMRGLRVVTINGERLSFGRSLGRTALKFVPWELAHTCVWAMQFAEYEISPLIAAGLT